jgi:hypothetical protein
MDSGLTKKDILDVTNNMSTGKWKDEISLCAVTAIGQTIRYEEKIKNFKPISLKNEFKEVKKTKLKKCFIKCCRARKQLRKCVLISLNAGLKREEILAITESIVGDFGKDKVSLCAIVAIDQVLKFNENEKLKKIVKMYAPYMEFQD